MLDSVLVDAITFRVTDGSLHQVCQYASGSFCEFQFHNDEWIYYRCSCGHQPDFSPVQMVEVEMLIQFPDTFKRRVHIGILKGQTVLFINGQFSQFLASDDDPGCGSSHTVYIPPDDDSLPSSPQCADHAADSKNKCTIEILTP